MTKHTLQTILKSIKVSPLPDTREGIISAHIEAYGKEIEALKKTCTTADLEKIDAIYMAVQELRLLKDLDKAGVGQRIQQLASYHAEDADEEKMVNASLAVIGVVGEKIRLLKNNS